MANTAKASTEEALEALVDVQGLAVVTNALAMVALGKAYHLLENWQDMAGAKSWKKATTALERAAREIAAQGL